MEAYSRHHRGRLSWVVGAGAIVLSCGLSALGSGPAGQRNPFRADPASIARGRTLYLKHCAACHGAHGRGDGTAGRDLDPAPSDLTASDVAEQSDAALFHKITRGKRPMPSFRKLMADEERWHVVSFLRTLAPRQSGETE